jgi:Flp pilus assembly protein TadD
MRRVAAAGTYVLVTLSIVPLVWVPWSPAWMAYKAYEAHVAGRYDAAINWYRKSLDLGGDRPWALGNLALAYQAKGATRETEAALAELRTLDAAAAAAIERDLAKQKRPAAEASK